MCTKGVGQKQGSRHWPEAGGRQTNNRVLGVGNGYLPRTEENKLEQRGITYTFHIPHTSIPDAGWTKRPFPGRCHRRAGHIPHPPHTFPTLPYLVRVIQEHFPLSVAAGEQAEVAVHREAHEPHLAFWQGEGLHSMI